MKIKELSEIDRPIERLSIFGKETLTDIELLSVLIKTGTKEESAISLAQKLLASLKNGIRQLEDISIEELINVRGIGKKKAATILAAIELGKRVNINKTLANKTINSVGDVVGLYMEKFKNSKEEHFETIILDAKGGIIAVHNVSKGDLTSSIVHPRETFREAIRRSGASIICVHNHPSGDPTPSKDDIKITKRLVEAGNIIGIRVLDHVVIGHGKYISMVEEQLIF